ncbi:SGNH/GDSL hydrolase family protein [Ancylobacter radicis]|uniref:DUF459 domain-containing protein n=1 Tax=Ancylobacter radicis TaxID=2836179 RepID=A0ABS5RAG0_9HYPH|nr:DUF459 domain-containing protein [Ancylobacter radicis]MBS9478280.1 DUF459 domain-containing protein [Ancylobacter radicis]
MSARRIARVLKALPLALVLAAGGLCPSVPPLGITPALAQSDWFRPPGNVGSPATRQAPSQQRQAQPRQQPRRQQAAPQAQRRQAPPPQRQTWSPFQPFLNLFRSDQPRRMVPSRPNDSYAAPPVAAPPVIAQPAVPRGTVFDTAAAARDESDAIKEIVLVLGDELAAPLAQGLADGFAADRESVAVVARTEPGSGFGPLSGFDWISKGRQFTAGEQPNVVVVFAGMNDLTPIDDPAGRAELFDERWRDLYGRRVDDFLLGLKLAGRPVVVVGLPPVEDPAANERNVQLNALLKERTERAGLVFADVTDGFVDEEGKFMMSGPDVDGQRRRLRNADGVGFTRAGGRKLAFFVDRHLDALLAQPIDPAAAAAAANPAEARPSIILLTGGASAGARTLAGAPGAPAVATPAILSGRPEEPEPARALVSGAALPVVAGRTDDFRWPAGQPAATAEPLVPAAPASVLPAGPLPNAAPAGTPASGAGVGTTAP